jgi:hypothetical protein
MITPTQLETRLHAVAHSLQASGHGLALLGLGSVGRETSRLDQWSDLDFFAIVTPGTKAGFLADTGWLAAPCPLDWQFRNTADGFKLLWSDGIFGEMAVFEPQELAGIPFAPGRVVWAADGLDVGLLEPSVTGGHLHKPDNLDYLVGELLSCLFVGLCRFRRGEKLSAWRFVQTYCLDRFLEIVEVTTAPQPGFGDLYVRDRRFEVRYPAEAAELASFLTGYEQTPSSALALLEWTKARAPVNAGLELRIRELILTN